MTACGVKEAADFLDFAAPSYFVWAYPMSREWLTLLIRRMNAVAVVYRLAATMSPGTDGLCSRVEFHRRGRSDATITLHDGRSTGQTTIVRKFSPRASAAATLPRSLTRASSRSNRGSSDRGMFTSSPEPLDPSVAGSSSSTNRPSMPQEVQYNQYNVVAMERQLNNRQIARSNPLYQPDSRWKQPWLYSTMYPDSPYSPHRAIAIPERL